MTLPRSWIGSGLAIGYLLAALWIVQYELRHTGGGWINLRGMGSTLATAPSQAVFGPVFRALGVNTVNFNAPGIGGYLQLCFHVIVTAALVYAVGAGAEWLFHRAFRQG